MNPSHLSRIRNPLARRRELARAGLVSRLCRRVLFSTLASLRHGRLEISETFPGGQSRAFGRPDHALSACIQVRDPACYPVIALGGDIGAGEAYMQGLWDADDLERVVRIFVGDEQLLADMESRLARLLRPMYLRWHRARENDLRRARDNISAHYDLGNDFYAAWLDDGMVYSCALFADEADSLEAAQRRKIDRLLDALALAPGEHLVEIGTGWGALAIRAAERYGVRVTTTTLSAEQARLARERIARRGLSDRVQVVERDYRELEGRYDALVSVEMIEAVGHEYLLDYFATIERLLAPHGRAAIQAITIADQHYERYRRGTDFINQYIFPGGCLPSVTAMQQAVAQRTTLRLVRLEDIGLHYARTLREWHRRLMDARPRLPAAFRDPVFLRMWEYYLLSCAGAFAERRISAVQMLYRKRLSDCEPLA